MVEVEEHQGTPSGDLSYLQLVYREYRDVYNSVGLLLKKQILLNYLIYEGRVICLNNVNLACNG